MRSSRHTTVTQIDTEQAAAERAAWEQDRRRNILARIAEFESEIRRLRASLLRLPDGNRATRRAAERAARRQTPERAGPAQGGSDGTT